MVEQLKPRKVSRQELIGKTFFFDGCVDRPPYHTQTPSGPRLNFTLLLQSGGNSHYNIRIIVEQENFHEYVSANAVPGQNVALLGKFLDKSNRSVDGQYRRHKLVVLAQTIRFG